MVSPTGGRSGHRGDRSRNAGLATAWRTCLAVGSVTPPNLWYDPPRSDITGDGASLRELDPIAWRREIPVTDRGHVHYVIAAVDSCYMTLHPAQAQHWHDVYRS